MTTILAALGQLDIKNDNHWTSEGLPKVDTVKFLSGISTLTRDDITKAAPSFSRHSPALGDAAGAGATQSTASDTATGAADSAAPAGGTLLATLDQARDGGANGEVHQEAAQGDGESGDVSNAPTLAEQLADAQERVAEIEHALLQGTRMRDEARAEADRLLVAYEASGSKETTGSAIRAYLDSQAAQLHQRGQAMQALRETGVDLAVLTALGKGAPIDAAMARQSGFGKNRPMFNPVGEK